MEKKNLEFKSDENGCFIVTSHRVNQDGYSYLYRNKKHIRAHRLIYEECFGIIPEGLVVRHKCDNPSCINPEHLELGTVKENMMDRMERGKNAKGEKNGRSIINEIKAIEIKKLLGNGMKTKEVAIKANVSYPIVKHIREGKTWTHITESPSDSGSRKEGGLDYE